MSAIVNEGLTLAFKLLVNKLRDRSSAALKHGDVTDQRFRDFIVRELNEINEKLDALCKTNLLAAADFFKTGVTLLYHYLVEKCQAKLESEVFKLSDFDVISLLSTDSASLEPRPVVTEMDDYEVLHLLRSGLTLDDFDVSDPVYANAKKRFSQADESATYAFRNEALGICDRVLAMKFRVAATLLQHLEEPEVAVLSCKDYLEQLNGLPEVREAFSVKYGGFNLRRLFCEMSREALINTVITINRVIWEFMHLCGKGNEVLRHWPEIPTGSRTKIHPVQDERVSRAYRWSFGGYGEGEKQFSGPVDIATDSKGRLLVADRNNQKIKLFSTDGKFITTIFDLVLVKSYDHDIAVVRSANLLHPQSVAVDKDDNVYICSSMRPPLAHRTRGYTNEIIALDNDGDFLWSFGKECPQFKKGKLKSIAVDDTRNRLLALCADTVFVLKMDGTYLSHFSLVSDNFFSSPDACLCVTKSGHVMVTGLCSIHVTYISNSQNAHYTRPFKPSENISSPFRPVGIAFNPYTEEVVVVDRGSSSTMMFTSDGQFIRKISLYETYLSGGVTVTRDGHTAIANRNGNNILIV